ncbi:MAG TPA: response regulator transcription factor [Candidatus Saccharimonadales bacterium]|nr:response regulator transcription factor [Candidatus Saccharimonadales bacterium]
MRILVVEDEVKIAQTIKKGLELKGYAVDAVYDGETGFSHAVDPDYDLVVLDRMLPGMDGVELCRRARTEGVTTPILMLTARGTIGDKVEGLNSGADDYLVKPFSFDELTARVRALLRRPAGHTGTVIKVGDLSLDTTTYEVRRGDDPIHLSQKEFALLEYLMHHAGQVVTKDMIISHVWDGDADVLPNTVEVYIGYLRNKIDRPFTDRPPLLITMRGFGYKLSDES